MRICLVLAIALSTFLHVEGIFFIKHSGFTINNTYIPFKNSIIIKYGYVCLAYCSRESKLSCLTAYFNEQTELCSLYDRIINEKSLIPQSLSVVYVAQSIRNLNSIDPTQPIVRVKSANGKWISNVRGITEILNDTSYYFITDILNNRLLKLDKNGEFLKSATIARPLYITNSDRFIYVNSNNSNIVKLNFNLDEESTMIQESSIRSIYFDISNNSLYLALQISIVVYCANDENNFTMTANISTPYNIQSITIHNDKIYTGTINGGILIYNKADYSLVQFMDNMCSGDVRSLKLYSNGDMVYLCVNPPIVNIIGINGINLTLSLKSLFDQAHEVYIDSKSRLWVGGNHGLAIFV